MNSQNVDRYAFDISIIVPIFNVEQYLEDCLNSIIGQRFSGSIQVLLINDCSSDNSSRICEKFANKHQSIEYLAHENNMGSAAARNTGLNHVSGKYFVFVDPDDFLPKNALATLYEIAEAYDADIVKGSNTIFRDNRHKPAGYNSKKLMVFNHKKSLSVLFEHEFVRGHPWGKIFRTVSFQGIRFTPGVTMAQDLLFCAEVFAKANKLVISHDNVYCYRLHSGGATGRKYQTNAYLSWLNSVERIGAFSATKEHERSHRALQVRTLEQIARECRKLTGPILSTVVQEIKKRELCWKINIDQILLKDNQSIKTLIRYIRYKYTLKKLMKAIEYS